MRSLFVAELVCLVRIFGRCIPDKNTLFIISFAAHPQRIINRSSSQNSDNPTLFIRRMATMSSIVRTAVILLARYCCADSRTSPCSFIKDYTNVGSSAFCMTAWPCERAVRQSHHVI